MLRRASFVPVVSLLLLVFAACSSVPDLRFTEDGNNPEGGTDGGRDTGVDTSAPDTSVVCVPSGAEVCDDDMDNDCNGLKDCADPACGGGFACAAPPPDGWQLVAFVESTPPPCPTGYNGSTDLRVLNGLAAHTCPCTCDGSGGSGPTCAGVTSVVSVDDENSCTASETRTVNSNAVACTALPSAVTIPGGANTPFGTLATPTGPAACAPNASITKTDPTDGRTCTPPAKAGTGCTGTNRCLPKPTGYALCIAKDGDQPCPTGFTATKRRAGTTSNDTRSCLACTCTAPTACVGEVTLWSNAACTLKSAKFAGSACATPVGDTNFSATHYKSLITGGCAPPVGNRVAGELTFGGERTICCK